MKIDRQVTYNLGGATTKQRRDFLHIMLEDDPKGWNSDARERFLLEDEDFIYWDEAIDAWEWSDSINSKSEEVIFIRESLPLKVKEIQYTDTSDKVTTLIGNFTYYFLQDKLFVCNSTQE